jgi:putative ABC transport system ATP-binding protein
MDGIGRTFRSGVVDVVALTGVDLRVEQGEYLAVEGPSGSGKSTLLNVLGLLDRPTEGHYRFEGWSVADLSERQRAAVRGNRVGFVFQAFHLLPHRTVLENVWLSSLYTATGRKERVTQANEAIDRVGLSHRRDFKPTTLSGGERQRVAIARAVVGRPSLLLCDEPTGNLDSTTSASVLDLFEELRTDGLTIVVVTHDETVSGHADRVVRMKDGRLGEGPRS